MHMVCRIVLHNMPSLVTTAHQLAVILKSLLIKVARPINRKFSIYYKTFPLTVLSPSGKRNGQESEGWATGHVATGQFPTAGGLSLATWLETLLVPSRFICKVRGLAEMVYCFLFNSVIQTNFEIRWFICFSFHI